MGDQTRWTAHRRTIREGNQRTVQLPSTKNRAPWW